MELNGNGRQGKSKDGKAGLRYAMERQVRATKSDGNERKRNEMRSNFIPTCPNGHTMEIRVSRRRQGDVHIWDAFYMCHCGWVSPKYSSCDLSVAERGAMEKTGVVLVPDDHVMTESEVKAFVRTYVI